MTDYLLAEVLIELNKQAVSINNDPHGILNPGNLQFATEAVKWKGESDEDPILAKAAFLLWYLANPGHVFIEGNKRTAQLAALAFLELNGITLRPVREDEMAAMVLETAAGKMEAKDVKEWLKENVNNPGG